MRTYSITRHRWYTRSDKANSNCLDCKKELPHLYRGDTRCRNCHNKFRILPQEIRFWKYVRKTPTCWLWTGGISSGYGTFFIKMLNGQEVFDGAHRVSWKMHFGEIPDGHFVLHKCDVKRCVKPSHLFTGTPADNMADKIAKGRQPLGSQLPHAKLTESQVKQIRSEYIRNKFGSIRLAHKFGTTPENIRMIVTRQTWKHVKAS